MKKLYIILFSILLFGGATHAQDIEIYSPHGNYTPGTPTILTGETWTLGQTFYVINTGQSNVKVNFSFKILGTRNPSFSYQFCDEISCKAFTTSGNEWMNPEPTAPFTLNPGDSTLMKPQILTGNTSGTTSVVYYILDGGNNNAKLDSIKIIYTSTVSINTQIKPSFNLYPNPANNQITIQGVKNNGILVISDALGNVVKKKNIKSSTQTIAVSNLRNGVYFVNVHSLKGLKSETKRLIIQ